MPRGRKRPPQDSIDSILLAMSRRSDIDPDTLSHYFDRLDEEWAEGARDKVLHLLRTNDSAAHSAAVLILAELATDFDLKDLEKFVADPTVSDMAKLTLAPVLKELGSDITDDRIIDYLNDPEAAMLQMQTRLLDLVGQSELGVESVLEDVTSMPVERRLGFIGWLGNSKDARAARLLVPLLESQPARVAAAAIEALEQLGSLAADRAIPALNHVIASSANRQVKQQARTLLGRLTMQIAPGEEGVTEANRTLPLYQARVSFIDGVGAQMIMLSWRRPDGLLKGVNVLYHDQWGIKDCYGTDEMPVERWEELVEGVEEEGFINFQVPLEYCRALIAEARALNKRTRRKLPIAYSVWRSYIGGDEAAGKGAVSVSTMLEPRPFNPELALLTQRGDELYRMPEFESWLFEPLADIMPYINRYWLTDVFDLFPLGSPQSIRGHRKGQRQQKQRRPKLEPLVDEALDALIDDDWRWLYETRLRRQGMLFQFAGRNEDAALLSAVASALYPDSGLPVREQAFPRAMIRRSIESGPMRMMAEVLEDSDFSLGPIPMDPFSRE